MSGGASLRRLALPLAAAALAAACGGPAPARGAGDAARARSAAVATDHVDLPRSYRFAPAAIRVAAGTRVTWTNHDVFTHGVRLADRGGQPFVLPPGDSVSFVFTAPGLHRYDCPFHPHDMRGTVEVTAAP